MCCAGLGPKSYVDIAYPNISSKAKCSNLGQTVKFNLVGTCSKD